MALHRHIEGDEALAAHFGLRAIGDFHALLVHDCSSGPSTNPKNEGFFYIPHM
ncbi:MAG: hypothetical protein U5N27_00925 [Rhizobium sp.]|nr:hypothetical protein [Rhizobium sp.]